MFAKAAAPAIVTAPAAAALIAVTAAAVRQTAAARAASRASKYLRLNRLSGRFKRPLFVGRDQLWKQGVAPKRALISGFVVFRLRCPPHRSDSAAPDAALCMVNDAPTAVVGIAVN